MPDLKDTFIDELRDLYDAEKQLTKGLTKMANAADNAELKAAFEEHLAQTQEHIVRLEKVFKIFGETARGKKCKAMVGLLEEAKELIEDEAGDAALICAAQKVEHYEIASYGSLVAWTDLLDQSEAGEILQETLEEEKTTDEILTEIAQTAANPEAEDEEEEVGQKTTSKRGK